MNSWAQRMHRRAATLGSVVTSCGHPGPGPYPHRLEKVKFGVGLDEVCKNDIPGPLLVLILKLNKEAPSRKDVFRAPGHQGAMKKLIHFLQTGRLVNVDNYSVYTIASVLKKFLRKIPGGIFGRDGELEFFNIIELTDVLEQQTRIHDLIAKLPIYTQRLLVLLFGTFRVIASNAETASTGMSSEALGVSVAPSFFQSCVSDGKNARMEDVLRYKVATRIMKQMIDQFTAYDLFGRQNYEYYARVTGRILRIQDEWICSFQNPPQPRELSAQHNFGLHLALAAEKTWLQCECDRWGLMQEESQSTPALLTTTGSAVGNSAISLGIIPEHTLLESCARLSVSLEGPGIFTSSNHSKSSSSHSSSIHSNSQQQQQQHQQQQHMTMDELRAVNRYAESTKSLSYLPQVHERQTARMRTRSEWFLGARGGSLELTAADIHHLRPPPASATGGIVGNIGLSASAESVHHQIKRPSRRGLLSRHHPHRSSSRRNKENGGGGCCSSRNNSFRNQNNSNNKSNQDNDSHLLQRKQRAVSFEKYQPAIQQWIDYKIPTDIHKIHNIKNNHNNINVIDDELMDTSPLMAPLSSLHHHHHHHQQQQQQQHQQSIPVQSPSSPSSPSLPAPPSIVIIQPPSSSTSTSTPSPADILHHFNSPPPRV